MAVVGRTHDQNLNIFSFLSLCFSSLSSDGGEGYDACLNNFSLHFSNVLLLM